MDSFTHSLIFYSSSYYYTAESNLNSLTVQNINNTNEAIQNHMKKQYILKREKTKLT